MPRGATTSKRQPAANQRDTRHENGLVGPGKRVQKQKSNGHLNGNAKSPESNSSTPPLPGTPPPANGNVRHPTLADTTADQKMAGESLRRSSIGGYSESSASEAYANTPGSPVSENHRQIDVSAAKNPAVHRDPLSVALTVLYSCPLWDTLAILIVLLQLPPTIITIVHLLFATLTFVPPSTAAASGLSFTDILQGTLGTMSIGTIFLIDVVVLMIWLFLWSPLQDLALDLAQTVIALTLGGGTSGREAGVKNVLWCFSVIGASHYIRNSEVKHSSLSAIFYTSRLGSPDPDDPLEPISRHGNRRHGLIRSILAIHILTQGVVRYIRDWYVRREKRDQSSSIGDPEAGKAVGDGNSDSTATQGPDNDSSTSLMVGHTAATSKRKKKHSAQVRIRQPLWAAIASTKIVMVKEYETSHTAAESAGTNATDTNNLGNAPFNSEADRIWITYVGSDEVFFSTSFFPTHVPQDNDEKKGVDSPRVDMNKPFYVKVNKTFWQPTRINSTFDPECSSEQNTRWHGEIFGLAPTSNYQVDFHSTEDDKIVFSTSVRTLQSPTADLTNGLSPNPQVTGRPDSPITTLKTSIATAELKLNEEKNRQKREKRDQQKRIATVRKDIDKLAANITTTGGNDDKLRQKAQQSNLHMRQAEDAAVILEAQFRELGMIPVSEKNLYSSSKKEIQHEREQHKRSRAALNTAKQQADSHLQSLKAELASVQQKCEGKQARITYLNTKHESLTDANAKGLDEVQRKARERQAKRQERENIMRFYNERVQALDAQINEGAAALQALEAVIEDWEHKMFMQNQSPSSSAQNLMGGYADPIHEDASMHPSYPWNPTATSSGMYTTGGYIPLMATSGGPSYSPHGNRTRGRSSSMLSNVSGFTEGSDIVPSGGYHRPIVWEDAREERKGSSGSGSGNVSGPGSVGDPKSPPTQYL